MHLLDVESYTVLELREVGGVGVTPPPPSREVADYLRTLIAIFSVYIVLELFIIQ